MHSKREAVTGRPSGEVCWGEHRAAGESLRDPCIEMSTEVEGGKELPWGRIKGRSVMKVSKIITGVLS